MSFWSVANIATTLDGRWLGAPGCGEALGASIDTRTLVPGEVFFAIRGQRVDGHDYLNRAHDAGSPLAVIDRPKACAQRLPVGLGVLVVDDSAAALGQLASAFRDELAGTVVIGVTGSNGKTTTTRLIDAALGTELVGRASIKSYNNALGLPLTVLSARPGDAYLVCEMGTSTPGEIAALGRIARPDIAVITSIGRAHLEGLGSVAGVAREKASLVDYVAGGGCVVVGAGSDELNAELARRPGAEIIRVGLGRDASVVVDQIEQGADGTVFSIGSSRFRVPLLGEHNAVNAAIAVVVARRLGLSDAAIAAGLATVRPVEMRLASRQIEVKGGAATVLDDAYNANPESTAAAVRTLAATPVGQGGRRVAILGGMLELGAASAEAHREIAELAQSLGAIDRAVFVGEEFAGVVDLAVNGVMVEPMLDDSSAARIAGTIGPGDVVLVKASRGIGLERVIEAMVERGAHTV